MTRPESSGSGLFLSNASKWTPQLNFAACFKRDKGVFRESERHRSNRACSSTVEQGTHNPLVLGSNPGGPTIRKHLPSLRVAAFLFDILLLSNRYCARVQYYDNQMLYTCSFGSVGYMQLICWYITPLSLAMVLTIHLGTETASNCAKNKPPAMVQVAYLADGWNAGLFNLFTETLSLFK